MSKRSFLKQIYTRYFEGKYILYFMTLSFVEAASCTSGLAMTKKTGTLNY